MPKGYPNHIRTAREPRGMAGGLTPRDLDNPEETNPFLKPDEQLLPTLELEGYHCKWMRVSQQGEHDGKNIAKHMNGKFRFEYIRPDELPHLSMLATKRADLDHGVIQVDDVVAVKTPQRLADQYFEAVDIRTANQFDLLKDEMSEQFKNPLSKIFVSKQVESGRGVIIDES